MKGEFQPVQFGRQTDGYMEGLPRKNPNSGESARLDSAGGWVMAAEFDRILGEILSAAGLGDEFRQALPAPRPDLPPGSQGPQGHDGGRQKATYAGERYEAVYVISVAARLVAMHPNTLRKYDKEGLVSPSRSEGRQRLYSDTDVQRLQIVRTLAERYGINLNGVRLVMDLVRLITGVVNLLENSEELEGKATAEVAARELRRLLASLGARS
ncbi:MAG: MerR family transcriptional regulator [Chloroflexi bacterium]|nr:MerR family transcriptional regulator [Chloroflexota bacterium]MDA1297205.1 MerR family transcriptional regulator [Chloroflexota bacterium]